MPLGYLVTVLLLGGLTALTLWPLWHPRSLALVSWWCGFVLGELPFLALYYLVASTLLASGQGDLDSTGGRVALGCAVVTATGLLVVVRRAVRARSTIEDAMDEGLGADWRATAPGAGGPLRRRLPLAQILLAPFGVRRRDVEHLRDLSYGPAGRANLLDVYRHRSHPSGGPVLVHLHGGGFIGGRKDKEARVLLYRLASQGWVCISANYRLSPAAHFPDHLVDAKLVVAWAREHGPSYGADPTTLVVSGSSAGGNLAILLALTPNEPAYQPGFEDADTSVSGAIALYTPYGDASDRGATPQPLTAYAGPGAPPVFLAHGRLDTYVGVDGAREFAAVLRGRGNPVVYAELPGGAHTFDLFHSIRFERVVGGIEAFTAWVRSRADRDLSAD